MMPEDGKMKQTKTIAVAAVFMMLAVGCVAIFGFSNGSDATQSNTTTVNVYFDGSGDWESAAYEKFNVFEAVQAACGVNNLGLYIETASGDDDWTETTAGNGTYPNPDYGTITKVGFMYEDHGIIVIDDTTDFEIWGRNGSDSTWTNITPYALGWIRPFTDYKLHSELVYDNNVVEWASAFANIAIKMDEDSSLDDITATGSTVLSLKNLTDPATRTDCTYNFIIKDTTGTLASRIPTGATFYGRTSASAEATLLTLSQDNLSAGIVLQGYGSDAYLALFHATNGAVVAQEETYIYNSVYNYYTNYSWMSHMFGVGTVSTPNPDGPGTIYDYWATYKLTEDAQQQIVSEYAMFNLGYHTNVPGSYSHTFPSPTGLYECTGHDYLIQYERSLP